MDAWCWGCDVSQPNPLPEDYQLTKEVIDRTRYAPGGLELPGWGEIEVAGLAEQIIRTFPLGD